MGVASSWCLARCPLTSGWPPSFFSDVVMGASLPQRSESSYHQTLLLHFPQTQKLGVWSSSRNRSDSLLAQQHKNMLGEDSSISPDCGAAHSCFGLETGSQFPQYVYKGGGLRHLLATPAPWRVPLARGLDWTACSGVDEPCSLLEDSWQLSCPSWLRGSLPPKHTSHLLILIQSKGLTRAPYPAEMMQLIMALDGGELPAAWGWPQSDPQGPPSTHQSWVPKASHKAQQRSIPKAI